ncbi:hypothetical protein SNE40_011143 [Patella caerulea]|uniref:PHD finger protein 10 n=1 Tax=Patella caerulea TaxID=87958 RepID=A0AAN8PSG1_PATCE
MEVTDGSLPVQEEMSKETGKMEKESMEEEPVLKVESSASESVDPSKQPASSAVKDISAKVKTQASHETQKLSDTHRESNVVETQDSSAAESSVKIDEAVSNKKTVTTESGVKIDETASHKTVTTEIPTDKDTREEKQQVKLDKDTHEDSEKKEKPLKSDTETISANEAENTNTLETSIADNSKKTTEKNTEISQPQPITPDGDNVSKISEKDGKETESNPSEIQKMEVDTNEKLISDSCEQPLSSAPITDSSSVVTSGESKAQDIADSNVTDIESNSLENMDTCVANTSTSKSEVNQESDVSMTPKISKMNSETDSKVDPDSNVHTASEILKATDPVLDSKSDPLIAKDSNSDSIPVSDALPIDPRSTLDSKSEPLIVKDSNNSESPPIDSRFILDSEGDSVAAKVSNTAPLPKTDPSPILDSKTDPIEMKDSVSKTSHAPDAKNDPEVLKTSKTDSEPNTDPTAVLNSKSGPRSPLDSTGDPESVSDTVAKTDPSAVTDSQIASLKAVSEVVTDVDKDPEPVLGTKSEPIQVIRSDSFPKDIESKSREKGAMERDPQPPTDTMTTKSNVSSTKETVEEKPSKLNSDAKENEAQASVEMEDQEMKNKKDKEEDEIINDKSTNKEADSLEKGDKSKERTEDIPAPNVQSEEKLPDANVQSEDKSPSLDVPSEEKLPSPNIQSEEKLPAPSVQSEERSYALDVPSEEKFPALDVPSEEKSYALDVPSEEKLPALDVPSEEKLPALVVPSEDKLPALVVPSGEKLPALDVPSEEKLSALVVPSEEKMEVDEEEVSAFKSISESKGVEEMERESNIGPVETNLDTEDTQTKTVMEGEISTNDIKTISNENGKSVEHTAVTSPGSVDTSEDSQFSVEAPNSPSSVDLNTKVRDVVTRFKETAMDGEGDTSMDVPAFEDTPLGSPLSMLHSDTIDNPEDTNMSTFSNQTTEGPTPTKRPRLGNLASALEEFSKNIITVDKLYEYQWPQDGGEWHMLQEQVSEYLSIKSFKRKYPDMYRRFVDKEEKEFLMDRGVVTETLCDLGLTAVRSDEIFDLMYKDYPEKYQEFTEFMHGKQRQTIFEQHKEYDALNVEKSKMAEYMKKAMKSAAEFNQQIQRDRKEERKAFFDMQTFHVHYPEGRYKRLPANLTKPSAYPIALLPGQFQEHYTSYTSDELKYLPINTAMYDPPKLVAPVQKVASTESSEVEDSQEEKTASSDGDSDGSSESGSNSDGEADNKQVTQKADPVKETTCRRCEKKNKNKKRIRRVKEEIINCSECGAGGHPTCLELTAEMVGVIQTYPWQCMECKTCVECMDPYDEDKMMFCDRCDRGYHTFCVGVKSIPTGRWECKSCKVTTDTAVTPKSKRGSRH